MFNTAYRAALFALYQFTIVAGIALLPMALAASRLGVTLPVGRLVAEVEEAYEQAAETPS